MKISNQEKGSHIEAAVCFYTPESWEELRKVAADKTKLDNTYANWLAGFHDVMTTLKNKGIKPASLIINISDLEQWCKQHNLENTSKNRADYASEMAMQLSSKF